jgi:hypothetical protein
MALWRQHYDYTVVLFCVVCFVSVWASPLLNDQRKREVYECTRPSRAVTEDVPVSLCFCGVVSVRVIIKCCDGDQCSTLLSLTETRPCLPNCPSGQLLPVIHTVVGPDLAQQIQCICPYNYTLDNETGCCKGFLLFHYN